MNFYDKRVSTLKTPFFSSSWVTEACCYSWSLWWKTKVVFTIFRQPYFLSLTAGVISGDISQLASLTQVCHTIIYVYSPARTLYWTLAGEQWQAGGVSVCLLMKVMLQIYSQHYSTTAAKRSCVQLGASQWCYQWSCAGTFSQSSSVYIWLIYTPMSWKSWLPFCVVWKKGNRKKHENCSSLLWYYFSFSLHRFISKKQVLLCSIKKGKKKEIGF